MTMTKEEQLEARIINLELLVHSLWPIIASNQSEPMLQYGSMLCKEHYDRVKDITGEYMKCKFIP